MPIRRCLNLKCNVGPPSWPTGLTTAGIVSSLLVCYSTSDPVHAEAAQNNSEGNNRANSLSTNFSHGKEVYTDYSVIGKERKHRSFAVLYNIFTQLIKS